ncbi:hypothetical protein AAG570_006007 [Ranatra chinensis]|uniref:Uncharacterized protein n=1 Tax=Ranatra chinensis TaxID=642074 RepID=A0ABD0XWT2_9HEMI
MLQLFRALGHGKDSVRVIRSWQQTDPPVSRMTVRGWWKLWGDGLGWGVTEGEEPPAAQWNVRVKIILFDELTGAETREVPRRVGACAGAPLMRNLKMKEPQVTPVPSSQVEGSVVDQLVMGIVKEMPTFDGNVADLEKRLTAAYQAGNHLASVSGFLPNAVITAEFGVLMPHN